MKALSRSNVSSDPLPIRILQFGEGNFLRAFVDWFVHKMNVEHQYDSGVAVVQPIDRGMIEILENQNGLFHHLVQGIETGGTVNDVLLNESIQCGINPFESEGQFYDLAASPDLKLIFSNTTEAGIQFDDSDHPGDGLAATFPGKLTQWLFRRYEALGDEDASDIGIIPCELIEANGEKLKQCISQYIRLWGLSSNFEQWLNRRAHFANTLVDRIVPGYPKDEIVAIADRTGFEDRLVVKSESFHLFVIEGDAFLREHFPADRHGFNVKYVDSIVPYRTQKVRILNGAHTSMVPVGLLAGIETVRDSVDDEVVGGFVRKCIFDEILKTIELPGEDASVFAQQVLARFQNPFIRHELLSISLNSISKWRVRVLPTVLDYLEGEGTPPKHLLFSLAALIHLHLSSDFPLKDDPSVLDFFDDLKSKDLPCEPVAQAVLSKEDFWGRDLTKVDGILAATTTYLEQIATSSIPSALSKL